MHITVIDGVFPQSLLAEDNLTFDTYKLPSDRNNRRTDALRAPDQHLAYYKQGGNWWPF